MLVFASWLAVGAFLLLLGFTTKSSGYYSRLVTGTWFLSIAIILCGWRVLFRFILLRVYSGDFGARSAAIIGLTESGRKLAKDLKENPQLGIRVRGFFDISGGDKSTTYHQSDEGFSISGTVEDAVAAAKNGELDTIYIALPMREESFIISILQAFSDTTATVHIVPDFFVFNLLHAQWHQIGDSYTLSVYDTPIDGFNSWLKRMEDLLLSTVILLLISPILLVIAVAIKLTSEGPVIFKQHRYGLDGRPIKVWKFRSMATQDDGVTVRQATRGDTRVTPLGSFLRRTSLDELPQFINVLQGTMSIVGPRPHAIAHNEEYRSLVDRYMLRHKVKPGITGWAQVNGWRGETDTLEKMSKRIEYDLQYIQDWSLWLDIKIIFLTIFRGFSGKDVY